MNKTKLNSKNRPIYKISAYGVRNAEITNYDMKLRSNLTGTRWNLNIAELESGIFMSEPTFRNDLYCQVHSILIGNLKS